MAKRTERAARWTESAARQVLGEWRASGETMAVFARRRGLHRQRLAWWARRVEPAPAFVPITIRAGSGSEPAPLVAALGADGDVRVEVRALDAASAEWVARLSRTLASAS